MQVVDEADGDASDEKTDNSQEYSANGAADSAEDTSDDVVHLDFARLAAELEAAENRNK